MDTILQGTLGPGLVLVVLRADPLSVVWGRGVGREQGPLPGRLDVHPHLLLEVLQPGDGSGESGSECGEGLTCQDESGAGPLQPGESGPLAIPAIAEYSHRQTRRAVFPALCVQILRQ